jgi:hypothetical protein
MAKLPEDISHAIALAEKADWPVVARNGKIIISAPDGTALTIGAKPNDEMLKTWRSTCRQYNLFGDGPAMTPDQQKEEAMATATKTKTPAQLKKDAEIAAAKEKALAAAAGQGPTPGAPKAATVPVVTFTAPAATAVTPQVVAKKVAAAPQPVARPEIPAFAPWMLTVKDGDYSPFRIEIGPDKGKFFCGNCWEHGKKLLYKAPQGLSSHRGYVHAAFALPGEQQMIPKAPLPEQIETAFELMRAALVEELTGVVDEGKLKELEEKVASLEGTIAAKDKELTTTTKELTDVKATLLDSTRKLADLLTGKKKVEEMVEDLKGRLEASNKLAEQRGQALDDAKKQFEAERQMLLARVEKDLEQFRAWANELAPVRAVGQIMDVVERYLQK